MKGSTALTKIRIRTKGILKKHPGMKYRTAQKQAAREYNAGTIPKKRKSTRKKVSGKRKYKVTHRVKRVSSVSGTKKRSKRVSRPRVTVRTRTKTVYRRIGASKKSMLPLILGGAAVLGLGYLLLKPSSASAASLPAVAPRTSPTTTAQANSIVQYAAAAGATISALTALINALNNASDSQISSASAQVSAGGGIPSDLSGGGGGSPWLA